MIQGKGLWLTDSRAQWQCPWWFQWMWPCLCFFWEFGLDPCQHGHTAFCTSAFARTFVAWSLCCVWLKQCSCAICQFIPGSAFPPLMKITLQPIWGWPIFSLHCLSWSYHTLLESWIQLAPRHLLDCIHSCLRGHSLGSCKLAINNCSGQSKLGNITFLFQT